MNKNEAKERLSFHSCRNEQIDDPRWECGFLGRLRPYKGTLDDSNFHDVMSCLKALAPDIRNDDNLPKELISDLMGIIQYGRAWGVYPEGMLRANGLITEEDSQRLGEWTDLISYSFLCLLEGSEDNEAFEMYNEYLKEYPNQKDKMKGNA